MNCTKPKFTLLTLLALPLMFAIGWWARHRNYEQDVFKAAEILSIEKTWGYQDPETKLIVFNGSSPIFTLSQVERAEMIQRLERMKGVLEDAGRQQISNEQADEQTPEDSAKSEKASPDLKAIQQLMRGGISK